MPDKPLRLDDDTLDMGRPIRERYEDFCGHFVTTRNPLQAYRLAFVVDRAKSRQWVQDQAARLLKDAGIMARVQAMRDEAAAATLVSVQQIIQDFHDIATADPNELVSVVRECCRFCHGVNHRYQWVSELEYAEACDKALRAEPPQPLPDGEGGFGFHPMNEPMMTCPSCFGLGTAREIQHDTTKVSDKARKLYAGVKKGDIVMHDQMKAREALGRIMGAFRDGIPVTPVTPNAQPISPQAAEQDAGRAYLTLIQGGKA